MTPYRDYSSSNRIVINPDLRGIYALGEKVADIAASRARRMCSSSESVEFNPPSNFAEMTLHVGLGTFSPVEVEDLSKHKMDSEQIVIPEATAIKINQAKIDKRRICAVGTTVMRTVESAVSSKQELNGFEGWTNRFIFPPFEFSIANAMITNFHQPKSTLMMQAAAFAGYDFLMDAYKVAIKEGYKFSTYGDAMLII